MKAFEVANPAPSGDPQVTANRQGISPTNAKEIFETILYEKFKGVQAQIQATRCCVRQEGTTCKSLIALLREGLRYALQFTNTVMHSSLTC